MSTYSSTGMQFQTPAISYYFDKVCNNNEMKTFSAVRFLKFLQIPGVGIHYIMCCTLSSMLLLGLPSHITALRELHLTMSGGTNSVWTVHSDGQDSLTRCWRGTWRRICSTSSSALHSWRSCFPHCCDTSSVQSAIWCLRRQKSHLFRLLL